MSQRWILCVTLFALAWAAGPSRAAPNTPAGPLIIRGGGGEVGFDRGTGEIVFVRASARAAAIARTPLGGDLWSLRLRGGGTVRAGDFLKDTPLKIEQVGPQDVRLVYGSAQGGTVTVEATGSASGVDLRLSVRGLADDVLDAAVPDDLSFDPASLHRVLFPEHLGIALQPSFFRAHAKAASWDSAQIGPEGLRRVAGVALPHGPAGHRRQSRSTRRRRGGRCSGRTWRRSGRPRRAWSTGPPRRTPTCPLLTSDAGAYLGRAQGRGGAAAALRRLGARRGRGAGGPDGRAAAGGAGAVAAGAGADAPDGPDARRAARAAARGRRGGR